VWAARLFAVPVPRLREDVLLGAPRVARMRGSSETGKEGHLCHETDTQFLSLALVSKFFFSNHFPKTRQDTTCVVCPLCGKSVKHVVGESIHVTFERHNSDRGQCDPSTHPARAKRCPVIGCKEKLTAVNAFQCKTCRVQVCLRHRHKDGHGCGTGAKLRSSGGGGTLGDRGGIGSITTKGGVTTQQGRGTLTNSRNTSSSAGSGSSPARPARALAAAAAHSAPPREVCGVCGLSFPHLAALIGHAESAHQGNKKKKTGSSQCVVS
jgi:hypothetical protein